MLAGLLAAGLTPALLMLHPCNSMADASQEVGLALWCAVNTTLDLCTSLQLQNACAAKMCAQTFVLSNLCCVTTRQFFPCILTLYIAKIAAALRNVCYVMCQDNVHCSHVASIDLPGKSYSVQVARIFSGQQGDMCDIHQSATVAGDCACVPGSVLYVVSLIKYEHRLIKRDVHGTPDDWVQKIAVWAEYKICLTCTAPDP